MTAKPQGGAGRVLSAVAVQASTRCPILLHHNTTPMHYNTEAVQNKVGALSTCMAGLPHVGHMFIAAFKQAARMQAVLYV